MFGEIATLLLIPIWFGSSVSDCASNCSKVTPGWFRSMCDPYRTLGRPASARVRMPALSLPFETIPGNDASGSVWGLPLGWAVGDPNSTVSDAVESRTKVTKFLIFVFMEHDDFYRFLWGFRGANRAHHREEVHFYTLSLIVQTRPWLLPRKDGEVRLWVEAIDGAVALNEISGGNISPPSKSAF